VTHFKIWGLNDIPGMAETRIGKFCTGRLYKILVYRWQTTPKRVVWALCFEHLCLRCTWCYM